MVRETLTTTVRYEPQQWDTNHNTDTNHNGTTVMVREDTNHNTDTNHNKYQP